MNSRVSTLHCHLKQIKTKAKENPSHTQMLRKLMSTQARLLSTSLQTHVYGTKTQYRSPATSKNMFQTDNNASLDFTISATQALTFSSSFNAPTSPLTTVHQEDRLDRLEVTASQAFNSLNNIHQQLARITLP